MSELGTQEVPLISGEGWTVQGYRLSPNLLKTWTVRSSSHPSIDPIVLLFTQLSVLSLHLFILSFIRSYSHLSIHPIVCQSPDLQLAEITFERAVQKRLPTNLSHLSYGFITMSRRQTRLKSAEFWGPICLQGFIGI